MRSFRRLFIILAEITQIVSLIVWTVGGTWAGARATRVALEYGYFRDLLPSQTALNVGAAIGGLIGFAAAATAAAVVFAFAQIEVNTREIARYYAERRRHEAAIDKAVRSPPRP